MVESKFELLHRDMGAAILSLKRALNLNLERFDETEIDLLKNGQVHKFEYNIELLGNLLRAYFYEKREVRFLYAKAGYKAYFEEGKIEEETYLLLMEAVESRNLLSHIYQEHFFQKIYLRLNSYANAIETAYATIEL